MSESRKKIIYVDDMSYSLLWVQTKLQKYYDIYPVQSAKNLFELLESVTPDLILLDIKMPVTDGLSVIRTLKADMWYAEIPVVFMTGNNDPAALYETVGLGAADLLLKTFSEDEIIRRIENQLAPEKQEEYLPVILAVDDNPSVLKTIHSLLRRTYRVHTLSRSEMLDTLIKRVEPDLFLLDCNMPLISGFELVPIIRAAPKHAKTPIVFLTSDGTIDTLNTAIQFGVSDFIVKPVEEKVLRDKLALHTRDYMILRSLRSL